MDVVQPVLHPEVVMSQAIRQIDVNEAWALAGSDGVVVIEVLPKKYWDVGHLPGAVWSTNEDIAKTAQSVAPSPDTTVLLYCASVTCQNSHLAADALAGLGYRDLRVFGGGKAAWKEAGLALEGTRSHAAV